MHLGSRMVVYVMHPPTETSVCFMHLRPKIPCVFMQIRATCVFYVCFMQILTRNHLGFYAPPAENPMCFYAPSHRNLCVFYARLKVWGVHKKTGPLPHGFFESRNLKRAGGAIKKQLSVASKKYFGSHYAKQNDVFLSSRKIIVQVCLFVLVLGRVGRFWCALVVFGWFLMVFEWFPRPRPRVPKECYRADRKQSCCIFWG